MIVVSSFDVEVVIGRIQSAIEKTWDEWTSERMREDGRDRSYTYELKRRIWRMGFEHPCVYPRASGLRPGEQQEATSLLSARNAHPRTWHHDKRGTLEHSTFKEFLFDVSWTEYASEYSGAPEDNYIDPPPFTRLLLAFESELGPKPEVVYDFDKLLSARSELRVMVWQSRRAKSKYAGGIQELPRRLEAAGEAGQGWWLLSAWGDDGIEHRVYHNGERQDENE